MLSVAEATAMVSGAFSPLPAETIALGDGAGRVLASDVVARLTQPPADVSAMDGYAVRSDDASGVPATLTLVGESAAGASFTGTLCSGKTIRISTGARMPPEADAIVIQEDTERDGDTVVINVAPVPGRWIRRRGLDFEAGRSMLKSGRRLTARDLGLAAAMNVPWLSVHRKPRIAFISTGDELAMPGDPVGSDQIISSNSVAFAAYARALGADPINLGIAGDTEASLAALVRGARGADMLVTMGGASIGDHDLVRRVLGGQGFDLAFYRIAMRPGKPLIFGRLCDVPVLGLPGNPVSVGVTTLLFVGAAIAAMQGRLPELETYPALLGCDMGANDQREDYLRARLHWSDNGLKVATPLDRQDSSMLAMFGEADSLLIRPPHAPATKAGSPIRFIPLDVATVRF